MIVFPLIYPEVFTRFKITPPRGVLFHGPPGNLAPEQEFMALMANNKNICDTGAQKPSFVVFGFFM